MCLVEVAESNRLLPSCLTAGWPTAWTSTPQRRGFAGISEDDRRTAVRREPQPRRCSVCVANTHCELQDLAVKVGMDHVRYEYQFPLLPVDADAQAVRHRPQPLHPVYPLRPRLR